MNQFIKLSESLSSPSINWKYYKNRFVTSKSEWFEDLMNVDRSELITVWIAISILCIFKKN